MGMAREVRTLEAPENDVPGHLLTPPDEARRAGSGLFWARVAAPRFFSRVQEQRKRLR